MKCKIIDNVGDGRLSFFFVYCAPKKPKRKWTVLQKRKLITDEVDFELHIVNPSERDSQCLVFP